MLRRELSVARHWKAIAAAFLALVFHTLLYSDFLEDPMTWTLLGAGIALAFPRRAEATEPEVISGETAPVPA